MKNQIANKHLESTHFGAWKIEEGRVEENEYDTEKKERTLERDPFGFATAMTYDAAGNVTSRTDHFGVGESWTYNGFGQVTSHTDREGNVQRFVYDAAGNLLSERATKGSRAKFVAALAKVPDVEPEVRDRLVAVRKVKRTAGSRRRRK